MAAADGLLQADSIVSHCVAQRHQAELAHLAQQHSEEWELAQGSQLQVDSLLSQQPGA